MAEASPNMKKQEMKELLQLAQNDRERECISDTQRGGHQDSQLQQLRSILGWKARTAELIVSESKHEDPDLYLEAYVDNQKCIEPSWIRKSPIFNGRHGTVQKQFTDKFSCSKEVKESCWYCEVPRYREGDWTFRRRTKRWGWQLALHWCLHIWWQQADWPKGYISANPRAPSISLQVQDIVRQCRTIVCGTQSSEEISKTIPRGRSGDN